MGLSPDLATYQPFRDQASAQGVPSIPVEHIAALTDHAELADMHLATDLFTASVVDVVSHTDIATEINEAQKALEFEEYKLGVATVTAEVAYVIGDKMAGLNSLPQDSSKAELDARKDILDKPATEALTSGVARLKRKTNIVEAEGRKDIADGQEIELAEGEFGSGEDETDAEVDPLDGTKLAAFGLKGATVDFAGTEPGGFMKNPGVDHMFKLFAPMVPGISINDAPEVTIKKLVEGLKVPLGRIRFVVMDRPANETVAAALEAVNANRKIINNGDVLPAVTAGKAVIPEEGSITPEEEIDFDYQVLWGRGGWPEGMISAADAWVRNHVAREHGNEDDQVFVQAKAWNEDPEVFAANPVYELEDLVTGDPNKTFVVISFATSDPDFAYRAGVGAYKDQEPVNNHASVLLSDSNGRRFMTFPRSQAV